MWHQQYIVKQAGMYSIVKSAALPAEMMEHRNKNALFVQELLKRPNVTQADTRSKMATSKEAGFFTDTLMKGINGLGTAAKGVVGMAGEIPGAVKSVGKELSQAVTPGTTPGGLAGLKAARAARDAAAAAKSVKPPLP